MTKGRISLSLERPKLTFVRPRELDVVWTGRAKEGREKGMSDKMVSSSSKPLPPLSSFSLLTRTRCRRTSQTLHCRPRQTLPKRTHPLVSSLAAAAVVNDGQRRRGGRRGQRGRVEQSRRGESSVEGWPLLAPCRSVAPRDLVSLEGVRTNLVTCWEVEWRKRVRGKKGEGDREEGVPSLLTFAWDMPVPTRRFCYRKMIGRCTGKIRSSSPKKGDGKKP